jgi:hypothetical protein
MTIVKPFLALKEMMQDVPENRQLKAQVNLCVKILSNMKTSEMMGASGTVTEKTKALFSMFHLRPRYEPKSKPMGGSTSIADKMVSDWKMKKNKALFEMFLLT